MTEFFPRMTEKVQQWSFNGTFGRNFERLFDLQMWCLGCDIRRERGNLLLEFGYERERPEGKVTGSSHYTRKIDATYTIHLWGFAVVVTGGEYGLCLKRHERTPRIPRAPTIGSATWRPHDMPLFSLVQSTEEIAHANSLLKVVGTDLYRYENFVECTSPGAYRRVCLTQGRSYKALFGGSLKPAWEEFCRKLEGMTYAAV
jgi:hypothetical protein